MALLEAGYLLLVTTLQALLAGLVLILLPLAVLRASRTSGARRAGVRVFRGHRARVPVCRDRVPAEAAAGRPPSDRCAGARSGDVPAGGRCRQRLGRRARVAPVRSRFVLGAAVGSCCSARVRALFDAIHRRTRPLADRGAGTGRRGAAARSRSAWACRSRSRCATRRAARALGVGHQRLRLGRQCRAGNPARGRLRLQRRVVVALALYAATVVVLPAVHDA